jgi:hypothetical protein
VTADVVTLAAPIEGYLQYGKLAPGDLLDNHHPVATIHDPLVDRFPAAQTRGCRRSTASLQFCTALSTELSRLRPEKDAP